MKSQQAVEYGKALESIESPLFATLLSRLPDLSDLEEKVRLAIVDSLGATREPAARDVLQEWAPTRETLAPDLAVALEAALLSTDDGRSPSRFLEMLASEDQGVSFPAVERLIAMTGSDHGLDPLSPSGDRARALASARRALEDRAP